MTWPSVRCSRGGRRRAGSSSSMMFHGRCSRGGGGAGLAGLGASIPTPLVRTTLRSSHRFTAGGSNAPADRQVARRGRRPAEGSGARSRSHTGRGAAGPSMAADVEAMALCGGLANPPGGAGPVENRGSGSTLVATSGRGGNESKAVTMSGGAEGVTSKLAGGHGGMSSTTDGSGGATSARRPRLETWMGWRRRDGC